MLILLRKVEEVAKGMSQEVCEDRRVVGLWLLGVPAALVSSIAVLIAPTTARARLLSSLWEN